MPTPSLKLKPNAKPRVLAGHPWVFANEVEQLLPPAHDGDVVECRDRADRFLGSGIYNSRSQIVWRRFSRDHATLDAAFLKGALERALARRGTTAKIPGISPHRPRDRIFAAACRARFAFRYAPACGLSADPLGDEKRRGRRQAADRGGLQGRANDALAGEITFERAEE